MKTINKAFENLENSYSPYSNFKVSAVLQTKTGELFTGVNIENASFSACNCAERTAFFTAINEGYRDFKSITIVSSSKNYTPPCGVCRQVMIEFCDPEFEIILAKSKENYIVTTLDKLMPMAFEANNME